MKQHKILLNDVQINRKEDASVDVSLITVDVSCITMGRFVITLLYIKNKPNNMK